MIWDANNPVETFEALRIKQLETEGPGSLNSWEEQSPSTVHLHPHLDCDIGRNKLLHSKITEILRLFVTAIILLWLTR